MVVEVVAELDVMEHVKMLVMVAIQHVEVRVKEHAIPVAILYRNQSN